MATIREVAELANVSPTTVSHVINNTRFVSPALQARVQAAMEQLDYRPNVLARSLRRGETRTLGLILPDSANPFFAEMARAVEGAAFHQHYSVMICNTEDDPAKEAHYVEVLANKQVDGLVFIAAGDQSAALAPLSNHIPPLVLVDRDLGDAHLPTVLADNCQGGYLAAGHLIKCGYHRLACIAGPSHVTPSAQRITGFLEALQEAGFSCPPERLLRGDFHPSSGYQAAKILLEASDPPDGIFACNDMMAIGVLRAALETGRSIPDEFGIVGFDNIELASYTFPSLTTIAQPMQQMAQEAVSLLVERINDSLHRSQRLVLPTELIVRQSTRSIA